MTLAIDSLYRGRWFKLICGASFHHLPSIHQLTLIYTLAGADCIDLAADSAIVEAAQSGIAAAQTRDPHCPTPVLMASFNDGEDPHFRKAQITSLCPTECPQPCLSICPPHAIESVLGQDQNTQQAERVRIHDELCYGCGRCITACPAELIQALSYQRSAVDQMPSLWEAGVRAIEIHTQIGRLAAFQDLWRSLGDWIPSLQLVSVSLGDGSDLEDYLWDLVRVMVPRPRHLIWQLDGRPMSGDIGAGTTRATLKLAERVAPWGLPGILQLAGGTNRATVPQISVDLPVGGVAYGSYARQLVAFATEAEGKRSSADLNQALVKAGQLVQQIKSRSCPPLTPHPWPSDFDHDWEQVAGSSALSPVPGSLTSVGLHRMS